MITKYATVYNTKHSSDSGLQTTKLRNTIKHIIIKPNLIVLLAQSRGKHTTWTGDIRLQSHMVSSSASHILIWANRESIIDELLLPTTIVIWYYSIKPATVWSHLNDTRPILVLSKAIGSVYLMGNITTK